MNGHLSEDNTRLRHNKKDKIYSVIIIKYLQAYSPELEQAKR